MCVQLHNLCLEQRSEGAMVLPKGILQREGATTSLKVSWDPEGCFRATLAALCAHPFSQVLTLS